MGSVSFSGPFQRDATLHITMPPPCSQTGGEHFAVRKLLEKGDDFHIRTPVFLGVSSLIKAVKTLYQGNQGNRF